MNVAASENENRDQTDELYLTHEVMIHAVCEADQSDRLTTVQCSQN